MASLSAVLMSVQARFDKLQARCFADAKFFNTSGRAERKPGEVLDFCDISELRFAAHQISDKVGPKLWELHDC